MESFYEESFKDIIKMFIISVIYYFSIIPIKMTKAPFI